MREWQEGYGLLSKYNFSFDLHCLPHQAPEFLEVSKKYPSVPVMVDHTGW
jgi:predicted TIM-barrel fold metal-dependent hydrolase